MTQSKNYAIQGIRFWAIALIVASHCGFLAQGGLGNCIFFAMSGFFVCQPFTDGDFEYKYLSLKGILNYYYKRIIRIIPVAWICMFFATWGLRFLDFRDFSTENSLLLNMFFIKSKGHLWFLQQEVFFYLLAPIFILVLALIKKLIALAVSDKKIVDTILFVILTAIVFASYNLIPLTGFFLNGNGLKQLPMLWLFFIGMSFAYLLKVINAIKDSFSENAKSVFTIIGTLVVVLSLCLTILTSNEILGIFNPALAEYYVGWQNQILCAYIASLVLVILSLLPEENWIKRFLGNRLFTEIGNASFSLYLIHGFFLSYFAELSVYSRLVSVSLISVCMALVIYTYIETPITNKLKSFVVSKNA